MHLMLSLAKQAGRGSVIDEDGEMGCLGQDAQQCVCSVKVQWLYSVGLIAGSQVLVCLFMPIERLCNLSNACHSILFFSPGTHCSVGSTTTGFRGLCIANSQYQFVSVHCFVLLLLCP